MRSGRAAAAVLALLCILGRAPLAEPVRPPLLLSFAGDLMHHRRNRDMPDYDRLYDSVGHMLLSDDLSFVNVEFPVDPDRPADGYPIFNGSVAYIEAAIRAGFDAFALANNHTYDLRSSGVAATARVFADLRRTYGVWSNGIPDAPGGSIRPEVILHNGWTIGFVSITAFSNEGGSSPHINLVSYLREPATLAFLDQVSDWADRFDLLVIGVHAGTEYVPTPSPEKQRFFRAMAEAGADIVWGHHPHVLQPWEVHDGSLIMYSAGNFVSAQRRHQSPSTPEGRWAPTGDTTIYRTRVDWIDGSPRISSVHTPALTMYDDPAHGLVLRSFAEVLNRPDLSADWRRFYETRSAVMNATLGSGPVRIAAESSH